MNKKLLTLMVMAACSIVMPASASTRPVPIANVPSSPPAIVISCYTSGDAYRAAYTRQKGDPKRNAHAEFDASGGGYIDLIVPPDRVSTFVPNDTVSRHYVLDLTIQPNVLPTNTNIQVKGISNPNPPCTQGLSITNVVVTITP